MKEKISDSAIKILKNNIEIQVAESATIGGKESLVVGNYDRDLLLRTKGSVRIQVQNKFYDLLSQEFVSESSDDIAVNNVHFVTNIANLPTTDGVVIDVSTGYAYYYYGGVLNPIQFDISNFQGFISYIQSQSLTTGQQTLAQRNIGVIYSVSEDVYNPVDNMLIYSLFDEKHLKYKDMLWQELYLHLEDGGVVKGNTTFSRDTVNVTNSALLSINAISNSDWSPSDTNYNGLFIGHNDLYGGLAIHSDSLTGEIILTSAIASDTIGYSFNTRSASSSIQTPMIIANKTVGIGVGNEDIVPDYDLLVGTSKTNNLIFDTIRSDISLDPYGKDWNAPPGAIMYSTEDLGTILEIDRIIEKSPELIYKLSGVDIQRLSAQSYTLLLTQETDTPGQFMGALSSYAGLVPNDILVGITTDPGTMSSVYFVAEIISVSPIDDPDGDPAHVIFNVLSEFGINSKIELFKVGNTSGGFHPNILNDGYSNSIVAFSGITNPNQLFGGSLPIPPVNDDDPIPNVKITPPSKTVVLGSLEELIDPDFGLNENQEVGLYSTNAYLKGEAILSSLTLGGELTWDNTTLTIADLETLKSRSIIAGNHLSGGGDLFSSNVTINHNAGSWTAKTTLSGASVISNLTVDSYGHLTNWSTRNLTPADIGAEPAFAKNTAFNKNFGIVAGTVVEGNDSRVLNGQIAFEWGKITTFTETESGDGVTEEFTFAHGHGSLPTTVIVSPNTEDSVGEFYCTVDAVNVIITYVNPPITGVDNLKWSILVK